MSSPFEVAYRSDSYRFTSEEYSIVNVNFKKLSKEQARKRLQLIKDYYKKNRDSRFVQLVEFRKELLNTGIPFYPASGYYFVCEGRDIVGVSAKQVKQDIKILSADKFSRRNAVHVRELLGGDVDNDGIPNAQDVLPYHPSDVKLEEINFASDYESVLDKRSSLKDIQKEMYRRIKEFRSQLPRGYKVLSRVKTPYSVIHKLLLKNFNIEDPNKNVLWDAVGFMISVKTIDELEQVASFIKTQFKRGIVEIDDKYKQVKRRYKIRSQWVEDARYKGGKKKIWITATRPKVIDYSNQTRTYTAIHYSILLSKANDGVSVVIELQLNTNLAMTLSKAGHLIYKVKGSKFDPLFQFIYDNAEIVDRRLPQEQYAKAVIDHFLKKVSALKGEVASSMYHYVPRNLMMSFYNNKRTLPPNTIQILSDH